MSEDTSDTPTILSELRQYPAALAAMFVLICISVVITENRRRPRLVVQRRRPVAMVIGYLDIA